VLIFPKGKSVKWAYDQLRQIADRANEQDKVLEYSHKILELQPDDLYSAYTILRAAEAKGDEASVDKWTARVAEMSQSVLAAEAKSPAQTQEGKERVALAKESSGRVEDSRFYRILREPDLNKRASQLEAFLKQDSRPEYRKQANPVLFYVYRTLGNGQRAYETAERMLREDANDEDALIFVADTLFSRRGAPERVIANSQRVVEILRTKEKPNWYTDAQWHRKLTTYVGSAYWMMGHLQLERSDFAHADASFRLALPNFAGDSQTSGNILFYLGWANYNLGKWEDAAKMYQQCAALQGPFQTQASRNVGIVRGQQKAQLAAPDLTAPAPTMLAQLSPLP
jgi:tetratricopeptide (TPR) repeat protein